MLDRSMQQELLASIIMNPDEDTPRLMYADVLMDSDDILDQKYGQYIKLAIELAQHRKLTKIRVDQKAVGIVFDDSGYSIDSYKWYLKGIEIQEQLDRLWKDNLSKHVLFSLAPTINEVHFVYEYSRGFIRNIQCTAKQFMKVYDILLWHEDMTKPCPLTAHPIREVEITNATMILPSTGSKLILSKIVDLEKNLKEYGIEVTIINNV